MRVIIVLLLLICGTANAANDVGSHYKPPPFLYAYPGGFSPDPHRTQYGCGIPPDQDVQEQCDYSEDQRWGNHKGVHIVSGLPPSKVLSSPSSIILGGTK